MATGYKEVIRQRIIEWQSAGWTRVPALSGAEVILDDLKRNGYVITNDAATVWLREVDAGTDCACWVVCAKGDPGAVPFSPC